MLKRLFKMLFKLLLSLVIAGGLMVLLLRLVTGIYAASRTLVIEDVPTERVAIVFGAGLWRDGSPTPVLRDRVATAADLYFNGKVKKLLMSGDNSEVAYNEPEAMRQYALSLGIPDDDIVLDYAGRRTYDTCYRAKAIFGVESAILVTQKFHLPRAIFLCNALGVTGFGVEADRRYYLKRSRFIWNMRELPATVGAFVDVYLTRPLPILGEQEPIFPE